MQRVERTADGLVSALLSLKKAPLIRYAKNSDLAMKIGQEVAVCILSHRRPICCTLMQRSNNRTACKKKRVSLISAEPIRPLSCWSSTVATIRSRLYWRNGLTRRWFMICLASPTTAWTCGTSLVSEKNCRYQLPAEYDWFRGRLTVPFRKSYCPPNRIPSTKPTSSRTLATWV